MATQDHTKPQKIIQGHTSSYKVIQGHTGQFNSIFCSLAHFLFPCLAQFSFHMELICSCFNGINSTSKTTTRTKLRLASFRTFERCSRLISYKKFRIFGLLRGIINESDLHEFLKNSRPLLFLSDWRKARKILIYQKNIQIQVSSLNFDL